jgi:transcriptional regulator with XRE-family HTH domain
MREAVVVQETIGSRIRRLRLARGMSQKQLALPGASYAYISRLENGHRLPSMRVMRLLAAKLGVTVEYLETGRLVSAAKERELQLAEAELKLRLGHDLEEAERLLREVLASGLPADGLAVRARASLGTLAARRGEHDEAFRELEATIATGRVDPLLRPDVYETLATSYQATGESGKAIELLEGCVATADADERALTQQVRFRTFLATAHSTIGDLDRARQVLDEATERAERLATPHARAGLYWASSRVAYMEGDADAALADVGRATAILEASEDTLQVARAHLLSAQIFNLERRPDEAAPHLARAERLLVFGENRADRGVLLAEQAKNAAQVGDVDRALALARESLELLRDDVWMVSNALYALGAASAAAGDVDAADAAFEEAVAGLVARGQWREAAQVSREWARALRDAGNQTKACEVLERATVATLRRRPSTRP